MSGYTPPRPDVPATGLTAPESWAYEGKRYSIGSAHGLWGIWVKGAAGMPPIETFPQDQAGWARAWARLNELDSVHGDQPFWRRRGAGWVVLNIAIGFVLWFGLLFAMVMVLLATGHDVSNQPSNDPRVGGASLIALVAAEAGWLLHCYLRAPVKTRRVVLAAVYGGAIVVGIAMLAPVHSLG